MNIPIGFYIFITEIVRLVVTYKININLMLIYY